MSDRHASLSLILCARNDRYMGNSLWRLQTALNYLGRRVRDGNWIGRVEVIVTDWGSETPLRTALHLEPAAAAMARFVEVPPHMARELQRDSPFAEVIALNAAARRSTGDFIGRIDQDTLIGRRFLPKFFEICEGRADLPVAPDRALFFANLRMIPYRFAVRCPSLPLVERFVDEFGDRILPEHAESRGPFYSRGVGIWLLHRDRWAECGGYDERMIYMNSMEINMIRRLLKQYPLFDLGLMTDYSFYHLEHYHPRRVRKSGTHRPVNPSRPFLDPDALRANDAAWGLADRHLAVVAAGPAVCRESGAPPGPPAASVRLARRPRERSDGGRRRAEIAGTPSRARLAPCPPDRGRHRRRAARGRAALTTMRALIVGLGSIGQRHVRNLRTVLGDDVQIDACRTRRQPTVLSESLEIVPGGDVEAAHGIRAFHSMAEALAQAPDCVFVCNPTGLHMPSALSAARAGCHLFIEKPLSDTWDGVEELAALVDEKRLVACVGYQMRFHPCLQRLRDLLADGRIGPVVSVHAAIGEYLPGWHPYEDYRQTYASRRDLGGGVVLTQIHEIDYLQWLFGLPRRVFALGGHLSRLEIDVEDTASVLMECVVDGRGVPVHLHQDCVQRPPVRTCQVVGDDGQIRVDFHALSVDVYDAGGRRCDAQSFAGFERNELFLAELRHFLGCLRGEGAPLVSVHEGARSLRVALAVRESIETGRVIDL